MTDKSETRSYYRTMNRTQARGTLKAFELRLLAGANKDVDMIRELILDAMTATTIEQNVGTIEAGAKVVGVKIDRLG